jgi:xylulokinase
VPAQGRLIVHAYIAGDQRFQGGSKVKTKAVFGIDIGTGSSKAILTTLDGRVIRSASRQHSVLVPEPGMAEMDAGMWWRELTDMARELLVDGDVDVVAAGVSGMGPCVLLTDGNNTPLRNAILYGIDVRATAQIEQLTAETGGTAELLRRCGSALSTQSVGPKLRWLADNEPETFARARRLYMPASWLAHKLTGAYVLDHHSASQSTPLYDTHSQEWYAPFSALVAPGIELPELLWPSDIAGQITAEAAAESGLPEGIPVVTGTIDAWTEAVSVGAQGVGDLMLMYGTTMFLINTVATAVTSKGLWGTVGAFKGTRNLAGGMATSGAITSWLRQLYGDVDYAELLELAAASGTGARGLLMLPYFAGERTPIADPHARGVIAGLRTDHGRGDLYRAALEATAFGVRHNVEAIEAAGGDIRRIVAVGGGTQGGLWTQIVSDVTGLRQVIPGVTVGASFGAAFLAAGAIGPAEIADWNPPAGIVEPDPDAHARYSELYELYLELYPATKNVVHRLAGQS